MLLYNVTVIIEDESAAAWLLWMVEEQIPKIMDTGMFVSNRLLRVLESPNEGVTFCTQYVVQTMEDYTNYRENFEPALQHELDIKFKDKYVSFRTIMEYIA